MAIPISEVERGLSPPTRGIQPEFLYTRADFRSIPAYAGDPVLCWSIPPNLAVYPRLRGGSPMRRKRLSARPGLSPPTRGIQRRAYACACLNRSIPAYAGDPGRTCNALRASAVYPRLRGGSPHMRQPAASAAGLSPPTRGIPARLARP